MLFPMLRYAFRCLILQVSPLFFLHGMINAQSIWSARRSSLDDGLHVDVYATTLCCYSPSQINVLFTASRVGADNYRFFVARSLMPTDSCGRLGRTMAHPHQN